MQWSAAASRSVACRSNLKLYQVPFTGYEFILPEDLPRGCTLCNAYGHEVAIAEFVLAGMLEWEIRLSRYDREFRDRGWQDRKPGIGPSHGELSGKTLGIVGYGHIGKAVAARAAAFGMRIIAVNRTSGETPPPLERLEGLDGFDGFLRESDYVLTTLPTAPETRGLFDAAKFNLMRGRVLINVGRAPVVARRTSTTRCGTNRSVAPLSTSGTVIPPGRSRTQTVAVSDLGTR